MVDSDTEIELAIDPAPFAAPQAPVSDLDLIAQMVSSGDVVGALPPVSMSAAEKRAQVEASRARAVPQYTGDESSSEEESSDDDDNSEDEYKAPDATPMTAEQHATMKKELEKFTGEPAPASAAAPATASVLDKLGGFEFVTDSEEEDDDDDEVDMDGFDFDAAGEDDGGDPGAIMSAHEQALPPVPQPPLERIPAGVPLVVAGDVVSWMKERGVEAWLEKQAGGADGDVKLEAADKDEADAEVMAEPAAAAAADADAEAGEIKEEPKAADVKPGAEATDAKPDAPAPAPSVPKFNSSGTLIIRALQAPGAGWLEAGSVLTTADGRILGAVHDTFGPLTSPFYSVRLPPPPFPYPAIEAGEQVFFPQTAEYRTFVDMHAVRDPRFRSDASNIYDEEVGDDEVEWSDDEAERAAKNRRKKGKGKRGARGATPAGAGAGVHHPLPARPHFDFAGDDDGPIHGEQSWRDDVSDAGSAAGRNAVVYDDDVPSGYGAQRPQRGRGRGRGGPHGGGRGQAQGRAVGGGRPVHALPARPGQWGQNAPMGGFGAGAPQQQQAPMQFWPQQQQQFQQPQFQQYNPAGYNPSQPALGIPGFPPQGAQDGANAPAINPRFAAQYQQMMGGYWPQGGQYPGQYGPQGGPYNGQQQ